MIYLSIQCDSCCEVENVDVCRSLPGIEQIITEIRSTMDWRITERSDGAFSVICPECATEEAP